MNKLGIILIDALILFLVSTVFVVLADMAFSGLKDKDVKDDPMVTAIVQGKTEELKKLVGDRATGPDNTESPGGEAGVIDQVDEHGRTALMRAAFVNYSSPGLTAKADKERAAMIPLLVDHGAPIDLLDHDGWTALMWASWSGMPGVAKELLDHGASFSLADKRGNTALTLAAERGNAEIVRDLLARGADKSAGGRAGKSALDLARDGLGRYPDKEAGYREIISLVGGSGSGE